MIRRTTLTAATCGVAAAALLLTACGGSKDDNAKITTSPPTTAPSPTTSSPTPPATTPPADPKAPVFDFPKDVKVTIDPDKTGDATKDAILRDQGFGLDAIYVAYTKHDKNQSLFLKYLTETAKEQWSESIDSAKASHKTVTGSVHYYNRKVSVSSPTTAGVTFCEDQRYSYDKDSTSGKVTKTTPSANSFVSHGTFMRKGSDGTWRIGTFVSRRGAKECQL
jgi:hypothetical protein